MENFYVKYLGMQFTWNSNSESEFVLERAFLSQPFIEGMSGHVWLISPLEEENNV